jgi:hypothetical protein
LKFARFHSDRHATSGSTRIAHQARTSPATRASAASTAAAVANVRAPVGRTSPETAAHDPRRHQRASLDRR